MKRLVEGIGLNSPNEYDRIFLERAKKPADRQDMRRWKRLLKYYKGGLIIDLGCLDSFIPNLIKGEMYSGIDTSSKAITEMKIVHPNANYYIEDLYNTKFVNEGFDYAVLGEVLEHLEHPEKAIKEAMRILKTGGYLALSVPLNEEVEPGAVDGDRHLWSFNIGDIINLIKPYGRVKTYILGSEYFPTYKYHFPSLLAYCKKK